MTGKGNFSLCINWATEAQILYDWPQQRPGFGALVKIAIKGRPCITYDIASLLLCRWDLSWLSPSLTIQESSLNCLQNISAWKFHYCCNHNHAGPHKFLWHHFGPHTSRHKVPQGLCTGCSVCQECSLHILAQFTHSSTSRPGSDFTFITDHSDHSI